MTVAYGDRAHLDAGLEWGQMWLVEGGSPEPTHGAPATVRRVLVARRKKAGNREEGYAYRYFVRLPVRPYRPSQCHCVLEMPAMGGAYSNGGSLFLTEVEAWEAYARWLRWYIDHRRETLRAGEAALAETEAIIRLRRAAGRSGLA